MKNRRRKGETRCRDLPGARGFGGERRRNQRQGKRHVAVPSSKPEEITRE
jgi:hypothetical protein